MFVSSSNDEVALEMAETSQHGGLNIQDEEVGWIAVQQGAHSFQAATGAGPLCSPYSYTSQQSEYWLVEKHQSLVTSCHSS